MVRLGLRVIEERQRIDVTQEQLAERLGLSRRQMNRIEAGTTNISMSVLVELSTALKVEIAELFTAPAKSTTRKSGRPVRVKSGT